MKLKTDVNFLKVELSDLELLKRSKMLKYKKKR